MAMGQSLEQPSMQLADDEDHSLVPLTPFFSVISISLFGCSLPRRQS